LILPLGKKYIHSIKNFSLHLYTADFVLKEILKVIDNIRFENFSSIISDNASIIVAVKKLINKKYPYVIPVRCIMHHINLLINNIIKYKFSKSTISNCMKIVKYFHQSYKAGAILLKDIKKSCRWE
jgi:hypothetical protein